jgi:hypothetical protein
MNPTLEVVCPLGEANVKPIPLAPRLNSLEGKTVGEIWNGGFAGELSFPIIREMLRERFPGVRIVPYTEFPLVTIASLWPERKVKTLEAVRKTLLEKGVDAVITGNGA